MKVRVYEWEDSDYDISQALRIDDKEEQYVGSLCECPEDAIIGRGLVSCTDIVSYMNRAYTAGVNGEPFDYELIMQDPETIEE